MRRLDNDEDAAHLLALTDAERDRLAALRLPETASPEQDIEQFALNARWFFHAMEWEARKAVLTFARFGNDEGILLVRNLPFDRSVPDTPADSRRTAAKATFDSELCITALATGVGEPIAYAQEKDGQVIQEVCPTLANASEWSSESSAILLPFHTEAAFHPHMPAYVLLGCVRRDREAVARTCIASIRPIVHLLSADTIAQLWRPAFETGIDFSFGAPTGQRGGGLTTGILYGSLSDPFLRYDPGLMRAVDEEAAAAMCELDAAIERAAGYVLLAPGDVIIIDNRRTVHARTKFTAHYDGMDRWLHRVMVVDGLADSAGDRTGDGRVIATAF